MTARVLAPHTATVWLALPGLRVVDLSQQAAHVHAERLRSALDAGLAASPDPRRAGFYEAVVGDFRYYFHAVPAAGSRPAKAFLLATMR